MRARIPAFAAILLILLVGGCIEQLTGAGGAVTGGISGNGITITKFYADKKDILADEVIGVHTQIANAGEYTARDVTITLFRLGELETIDNQPTRKEVPYLEPADPATNTPADKREASWLVRARDTRGITGTRGYNLGLRAEYRYGSDGWKEMLVTEREQSVVQAGEGGTPQTIGGITRAPVETQVFAPDFLMYDDVESLVNMRVDLVNVGGGTVFCEDGEGEKKLFHVCEIVVRIPSGYLELAGKELTADDGTKVWCCKEGCKDEINPQDRDYYWQKVNDREGREPTDAKWEITLNKSFDVSEDTEIPGTLELMGRGTYKNFVCWFNVNKENVGIQEKIPIRASSEYYYSTEKDLLVSVHGTAIR